VCLSKDPQIAMDLLKRFSNLCRQSVFEGKTKDLFDQCPNILKPLYRFANNEEKLQLSFIGRALPNGYRESTAIDKHVKAYTSTPVTSGVVLS